MAPWDEDESISNATMPMPTIRPANSSGFCVWVLVYTIDHSGMTPMELCLLFPNVTFFIFLIVSLPCTAKQVKTVGSPIVTTFYVLVWLTCFFGTLRCLAAIACGGYRTLPDQILWLFVRFFQLMTELSVLALGLLYGHLDSRQSIAKVMPITIVTSFVYCVAQGLLEEFYHKKYFQVDIYLYGGLIFSLCSAIFFTIIYALATSLRCLPVQQCGIHVPRKTLFYVYTAFFTIINLLLATGSSLFLFKGDTVGFCLCDFANMVYFSLFAPTIYAVFLVSFLHSSRPRHLSAETSHLLDYSYRLSPDRGNRGRLSLSSSLEETLPAERFLDDDLLSNGSINVSACDHTQSGAMSYQNGTTAGYRRGTAS